MKFPNFYISNRLAKAVKTSILSDISTSSQREVLNVKLFGSDFKGSLTDAGWGFAGFYAQKLLHEKIVEPAVVQNLKLGLQEADMQLILNVLGIFVTAPVVGNFFGGRPVTMGGMIWHFARGLKIVLAKVGAEQYLTKIGTIPY